MKSIRKAIPAIILGAAVLAPPVAQASPDSNGGDQEVATVEDLMNSKGLSGRVETSGHTSSNDGAGMTFSVSSSRPSGASGDLAVPLADGKWAVPTNLPTKPSTQPDAAAVEDEIARAKTFTVSESELIWDSTRPTPLTGEVVHEKQDKPYAVTCSSFVGMVLQGWNYESTTFVSDTNTRVGNWVDFGDKSSKPAQLGQAHKLAAWFYANGDMWLDGGKGQFQRGDILFFSKQAPEGQDTTGTYFANVYHVAIYLGDGKVIHSAGRSTGAGVVEAELTDYLRSDLTFVARPSWEGTSGSGTTSDPDGSQATDGAQNQATDGSSSSNSSSSGSSADTSGSTGTDGQQAEDRQASNPDASAESNQQAADPSSQDGASGDASADPAADAGTATGDDPAAAQSQAAADDPAGQQAASGEPAGQQDDPANGSADPANAGATANAGSSSATANASDPQRQALSSTGTNVGMLLAVMVLLLASGIAALVMLRRRRGADG